MIRFRASRLRAAVAATGAAAAISALALSPAADAGTSGPAIAPPASTGGAMTRAAEAGAGIASATVPAERTAAPTASAGGAPPEASPRGDFYLRAGIAFDRSRETRFRDRDCNAPRPGHFYGCGPGVDGAPYSSLGGFGTISGFELGIGYFASPPIRIETSVQYRPSFSFTGHHNYSRKPPRSVSADMSSLSAIVAAHVDLAGLGVSRLGPFSPFVGGGVGLARIDIDETRLNFRETVVILPGERRVNFAWMLAAGVAAPLGERMTLDLAWRYTNSGSVVTGRGTGRTECRIKGCERDSEYEVPETRANLRSHGLHVSVRYAF